MEIHVSKASHRRIKPFRDLYRREMDCQIVHDSWHERGFTQSYLIRVDHQVLGYGSVGGVGKDPKNIVKEFFLHEANGYSPETLFMHFVGASGARRIEAQTNDRLLSQMLNAMAEDVEHPTRLFEDGHTPDVVLPGATFRKIRRPERRRVFNHEVEPVGDWVVELDGEIVATGGLMFHYNPPYSDVYMEVAAPWRRRGIGAFLVHQLKQLSYEMQKVPAARCSESNVASKRTLEKAGMVQCGWIAEGNLRPDSRPGNDPSMLKDV